MYASVTHPNIMDCNDVLSNIDGSTDKLLSYMIINNDTSPAVNSAFEDDSYGVTQQQSLTPHGNTCGINKAGMKIVPCSDTSPLRNGKANLGPDQQGWDPSNPSIVSQTQEAFGDSPYLSSDNEEGCIAAQADDSEFGPVAAQINSVFDDKDDFISAEIEAITDH